MSTNNKPKLKILSAEEANELLIKWYNGHFTYIEVSEIINERAAKIVSLNAECLEALIKAEKIISDNSANMYDHELNELVDIRALIIELMTQKEPE